MCMLQKRECVPKHEEHERERKHAPKREPEREREMATLGFRIKGTINLG